jgi:hypothetical protein
MEIYCKKSGKYSASCYFDVVKGRGSLHPTEWQFVGMLQINGFPSALWQAFPQL